MHGVNVRAVLGTVVLIRCLSAFPDPVVVIGSHLEEEAVVVPVVEQWSPYRICCSFVDLRSLVHVDGCFVQLSTWSSAKFLV